MLVSHFCSLFFLFPLFSINKLLLVAFDCWSFIQKGSFISVLFSPRGTHRVDKPHWSPESQWTWTPVWTHPTYLGGVVTKTEWYREMGRAQRVFTFVVTQRREPLPLSLPDPNTGRILESRRGHSGRLVHTDVQGTARRSERKPTLSPVQIGEQRHKVEMRVIAVFVVHWNIEVPPWLLRQSVNSVVSWNRNGNSLLHSRNTSYWNYCRIVFTF